MAKEKKTRKREKKLRKGRKHESVKPHKYYEVRGSELKRNRNFCPRCGSGTWLSRQKGRLYCGKCGYTDFQKGERSGGMAEMEKKETPETRPEEKPPEEKPSEQKAE